MNYMDILNDNWADYSIRKTRMNLDSACFDFSSEWEVNYLTQKIHKHYPFIAKQTIQSTVEHCASTYDLPHKREAFVKCVLEVLAHARQGHSETM